MDGEAAGAGGVCVSARKETCVCVYGLEAESSHGETRKR